MKSILILLCVVALFGFIVSQIDKPLADSMQAYRAEMTAVEGEPKSLSVPMQKQNGEAKLSSHVNQMNNLSARSADNNALALLSGDNSINLNGVSELIGSQNFEQQLQDISALKVSERSYELEKKINWILQDSLANTPILSTDILCSEDLCGFVISNASQDELSAFRKNLLVEYQDGSLFIAQMNESAGYSDSNTQRVIYFPYRNTIVETPYKQP
jgi:hypothetical protein